MSKLNRRVICGGFLLMIFFCSFIVYSDTPPLAVQNAHSMIYADFYAEIQDGIAPLDVQFTDSSGGDI